MASSDTYDTIISSALLIAYCNKSTTDM